MNVKELIEKIEALPTEDYKYSPWIDKKVVLGLVRQLDEPEKVTIPQFVADWIEVCKEHLTPSLYTAMNPNFMKENNQSFDLILWIKKTSNQETFARAWLDGYEVEKGKRYIVVMKETKQPLYYNAGDKKLFFSMAKIASHFTKQQLEKLNFGWVFNCEGVEVEEVEG